MIYSVALLAISLTLPAMVAQGLSWTDPNTERNCHTLFTCSTVRINQGEIQPTPNLRVRILHVMEILFPAEATETVDISLVLETNDHIKRTFAKEGVHIKTDDATGLRYCELDYGAPEGTGVETVWSVDTIERDRKGQSSVRHKFR